MVWSGRSPGGSTFDQTGYKYRMNNIITAALGLVQLEKLGEMQRKRHTLVKQYYR